MGGACEQFCAAADAGFAATPPDQLPDVCHRPRCFGATSRMPSSSATRSATSPSPSRRRHIVQCHLRVLLRRMMPSLQRHGLSAARGRSCSPSPSTTSMASFLIEGHRHRRSPRCAARRASSVPSSSSGFGLSTSVADRVIIGNDIAPSRHHHVAARSRHVHARHDAT